MKIISKHQFRETNKRSKMNNSLLTSLMLVRQKAILMTDGNKNGAGRWIGRVDDATADDEEDAAAPAESCASGTAKMCGQCDIKCSIASSGLLPNMRRFSNA